MEFLVAPLPDHKNLSQDRPILVVSVIMGHVLFPSFCGCMHHFDLNVQTRHMVVPHLQWKQWVLAASQSVAALRMGLSVDEYQED